MGRKNEFTSYKRRAGIIKYFEELGEVDYRLIISILFLLMFGIIMIYSATSAISGSDPMKAMLKQAVIGICGLIAMIFISYIDYHVWVKYAFSLYLISLFSVLLVRIPGLGVYSNGAYRWINLGPTTFQPAELLKPAIVLLMSYMLVQIGKNLTYFKADAITMIPVGLAAMEILFVTRNLSTALIVLGVAVLMFFVAHPNKKIWVIVIACLLLAVLMGIIYYNWKIKPVIAQVQANGSSSLDSFRAGRILAWLYPEMFTDLSMQSRYSLYAIGFGGILGRGLGHGTMKYYLPERDNDFIFAVIGEELGLVGCLLVIFLFIYQVWRIMVISQHAKDSLGSLIAFGIGAHVALQALLNIGVATSILPNTGISLPYISNGGTALFIQLAEMGIVLNVGKQIPGKKVMVLNQENVGESLRGSVHISRRRRSG